MSNDLRAFVAVNIKVEKPLKDKWIELRALLRNDSIKWVDDHLMHLTLFFLGDIPPEIVTAISSSLENKLLNTNSFDINIQGIGCFGNPRSPRVIWAGVAKSEQLTLLQRLVGDCIQDFGIESSSEKFSPHLTLGRVKHIASPDKLNDFIKQCKSISFQQSRVDKVIFYQSILRPEGPIYKPLKEIKLLSL